MLLVWINSVDHSLVKKTEQGLPSISPDIKEIQVLEEPFNGMEVDLEKKNVVNGNTQIETASAVGGLGQGSPKVSLNDTYSVQLNLAVESFERMTKMVVLSMWRIVDHAVWLIIILQCVHSLVAE